MSNPEQRLVDAECSRCGIVIAIQMPQQAVNRLAADHDAYCMAVNIKLILDLLIRWEKDRTA